VRRHATIRRGQIAIWTISLAATLPLYLVMHRLLTLVYRKQVEEETLPAEVGRLEADVAQCTDQLLQAQKMEAVGLLAGASPTTSTIPSRSSRGPRSCSCGASR